MIQWFLVYLQNCKTITTINFRLEYHPKRDFIPINSYSQVAPNLPALGNGQPTFFLF